MKIYYVSQSNLKLFKLNDLRDMYLYKYNYVNHEAKLKQRKITIKVFINNIIKPISFKYGEIRNQNMLQ